MPRGRREPPLPQGPAIFLYISIENFPPAGHTVFDGSRKAGVFMDRQSRKAGWGTALCMFLLLCWAAAPWVAAAQRLTAPEERAEEFAARVLDVSAGTVEVLEAGERFKDVPWRGSAEG